MWVTCTEVNLNLPKSQTQRALCLAVAPATSSLPGPGWEMEHAAVCPLVDSPFLGLKGKPVRRIQIRETDRQHWYAHG